NLVIAERDINLAPDLPLDDDRHALKDEKGAAGEVLKPLKLLCDRIQPGQRIDVQQAENTARFDLLRRALGVPESVKVGKPDKSNVFPLGIVAPPLCDQVAQLFLLS